MESGGENFDPGVSNQRAREVLGRTEFPFSPKPKEKKPASVEGAKLVDALPPKPQDNKTESGIDSLPEPAAENPETILRKS